MKRAAQKAAPSAHKKGYCEACGLVAPAPVTYEWDCHLDENGEMLQSCSDDCRSTLGFKRRKPVIAARVPVTVDLSLDDW